MYRYVIIGHLILWWRHGVQSRCHVRYKSRGQHCYYQNPWPQKHMIRHKNYQIRANSSRDVELYVMLASQCPGNGRHDVTVRVTMTELFFIEILDPENIGFNTKSIKFGPIVLEMLNYMSWWRHDVSSWRHDAGHNSDFIFIENFDSGNRIQNRNHQIRTISSWHVELYIIMTSQCPANGRHDVTVRVTITALLFSKSSTSRTYDSTQKPSNLGK